MAIVCSARKDQILSRIDFVVNELEVFDFWFSEIVRWWIWNNPVVVKLWILDHKSHIHLGIMYAFHLLRGTSKV